MGGEERGGAESDGKVMGELDLGGTKPGGGGKTLPGTSKTGPGIPGLWGKSLKFNRIWFWDPGDPGDPEWNGEITVQPNHVNL